MSPLADLIEMQCLWFIQEEGASYSRQHKYALALKRFHQIFAVSCPYLATSELGAKLTKEQIVSCVRAADPDFERFDRWALVGMVVMGCLPTTGE